MSNTKNINVNVTRPPTNIQLGRCGENLATRVIFDCTGLVQLYGDGTAELLHELKDGTVYPVAIKQDGTSVSWTVSASDTATVGAGRAELRWYVGDTLAKSAKFRTSVSSALADSTTETPPEPQKSWVDKVLAAAQEIKDGAISDDKLAEAIAQALAEAKASGQFDGEPGKDGADGSPGADGADGVGIQSVVQTTTSAEDGGTNVITVTKTDGSTSTFEVRNGSKGNDGAPGKDGTDGAPGKDGISATHSWNGTVLTITSASGTSSADLKGDKGDKGEPGEQGIPGTAGSDANVTAENIRSALGYTPADSEDLAEKLQKSPADWEPWTVEEQAAARGRMGMVTDTPFELVGDVTTEEAVQSIVLMLSKPCRYISITLEIPPESVGASRNVYFSATDKPLTTKCFHRSQNAKTSEIDRAIYKSTAEIVGGEIISYGGISAGTNMPIDYTNRPIYGVLAGYGGMKADSFTNICVFTYGAAFPAGSSIKIYGC